MSSSKPARRADRCRRASCPSAASSASNGSASSRLSPAGTVSRKTQRQYANMMLQKNSGGSSAQAAAFSTAAQPTSASSRTLQLPIPCLECVACLTGFCTLTLAFLFTRGSWMYEARGYLAGSPEPLPRSPRCEDAPTTTRPRSCLWMVWLEIWIATSLMAAWCGKSSCNNVRNTCWCLT